VIDHNAPNISSGAPLETDQSIRHATFDLPTFDDTIPAYYAAPAGEHSAPVVLVIQEIFGVNEHIRDICRRFAREGYMAVAVELYHRQGKPQDYPDVQRLISEIVAKVPDEQVMADLDASVEWAVGQGGDATRLAVTGFCWGGRLTWLYAAHNPACRAAAAWYGRLVSGHGPTQVHNPIDVCQELHAPVLGLYGGKDTGIPVDDVRRMEAALSEGNASAQASHFVVYPESGHAFFADYRPSYVQADAVDAWQRMLGWFKRYMG
jgi:carboxymethylenebutenolidase